MLVKSTGAVAEQNPDVAVAVAELGEVACHDDVEWLVVPSLSCPTAIERGVNPGVSGIGDPIASTRPEGRASCGRRRRAIVAAEENPQRMLLVVENGHIVHIVRVVGPEFSHGERDRMRPEGFFGPLAFQEFPTPAASQDIQERRRLFERRLAGLFVIAHIDEIEQAAVVERRVMKPAGGEKIMSSTTSGFQRGNGFLEPAVLLDIDGDLIVVETGHQTWTVANECY